VASVGSGLPICPAGVIVLWLVWGLTAESVMKHLPLAALAFALMLLAAPGARAFTIENQDSATGGAQNFLDLSKPKITDPDEQLAPSGGRPGTFNFGNGGTLQFGTQGQFGSFDQRYNPSNLFDPYARNGRY
jgi:hypothetical protein